MYGLSRRSTDLTQEPILEPTQENQNKEFNMLKPQNERGDLEMHLNPHHFRGIKADFGHPNIRAWSFRNFTAHICAQCPFHPIQLYSELL